jgi:hypothetical protein
LLIVSLYFGSAPFFLTIPPIYNCSCYLSSTPRHRRRPRIPSTPVASCPDASLLHPSWISLPPVVPCPDADSSSTRATIIARRFLRPWWLPVLTLTRLQPQWLPASCPSASMHPVPTDAESSLTLATHCPDASLLYPSLLCLPTQQLDW